mmetsp:Transcript_22452/g.62531  ORF Transcript_22452/g.62531 Transcript_22452/m.62531 type:complete len:141 (+) Transcript_22452:805-1227(+)
MTLSEGEIKSIFSKYSGGGSIGSKDIGSASRAGGLNPSEADLDSWKDEASKGLDLNGFQKFIGKKLDESNDSTDDIIEAFQAFDTDGTGKMQVAELKVILTTMGEKLSEPEVKTLLDECDVEDGEVSYHQLAQMLFMPSH